jgi:hypothetical protein
VVQDRVAQEGRQPRELRREARLVAEGVDGEEGQRARPDYDRGDRQQTPRRVDRKRSPRAGQAGDAIAGRLTIA